MLWYAVVVFHARDEFLNLLRLDAADPLQMFMLAQYVLNFCSPDCPLDRSEFFLNCFAEMTPVFSVAAACASSLLNELCQIVASWSIVVLIGLRLLCLLAL